jgi:hypothetical protein
VLQNSLETLLKRALPDGGFSSYPGREYRPDSTAWAVLAFKAAGLPPAAFDHALSRLKKSQLPDGRVSLAPDHPEVIWPTPLAILAWHGLEPYKRSQDSALNFLLRTSAKLKTFQIWPPFYKYNEVPGWPWVENTYSWVEPTALSLIALKTSGLKSHPRVQGGIQMLLERQLPQGGWNYGNTVVFDQELIPLPDTTGAALTALAGLIPKNKIDKSLAYLRETVKQSRTPLSLGWGVYGLDAWGEKPEAAEIWIQEALKKQESFSPLDTSALSLLIIAYHKNRS